MFNSRTTSYTPLHRENPIHDSVHVPEFRQICNEEMKIQVPIICKAICQQMINEAVSQMVGALQYDINTSLTIAFNDCEAMFKSSKARQFVSDRIMAEIKKGLSGIDVKLDI